MAHYAFIDENSQVVNVIVGKDENETVDGVFDWEKHYSEVSGYQVVRTSFNTLGGIHYSNDYDEIGNRVPSEDQSKALRYNYAGIGFRYDPERDGFIPPKPFDSWVLDEATCLWTAPIEYPADGGEYTWDESEGDWVEVVSETT